MTAGRSTKLPAAGAAADYLSRALKKPRNDTDVLSVNNVVTPRREKGLRPLIPSLAATACGVIAVALLMPSATPAARADHTLKESSRQTLFVAKRPGLLIKLWVGPKSILGSTTYSRLRCEGGFSAPGSVDTVEGYSNFPLRPGGFFQKRESESYEGAGSYFWALSGRVRPNRIIGSYTAWEELGGEEGDFPPRCGTLFPRGRPRHFVARRVAGPRWHGSGLTAAVRNHWVDGWCGDHYEDELQTCETVLRHGSRVRFELVTGRLKGGFRLCVTPPHGGVTCHRFRLREEWEGDEVVVERTIDFARHFPHRQRGRYTVRWYWHGRQHGRALHFHPHQRPRR